MNLIMILLAKHGKAKKIIAFIEFLFLNKQND